MSVTEIIQEEMGLNDRHYGPARHRGELPSLHSPTLEALQKTLREEKEGKEVRRNGQ